MYGDYYTFLGAPGQTTFRLMMVAHGLPDFQPTATLVSSASRHPVALQAQQATGSLRSLLREAQLQVFVGEAEGLSPNTEYDLLCTPAPRHRRGPALVRTLPASVDQQLQFAVASCNFLGYDDWSRNQVAGEEIYRRFAATGGFVLNVGDNVYCDVPTPERGQISVVDRYADYFTDESFEQFRLSSGSFSTFDDHELWNDFPFVQAHLPWAIDPALRRKVKRALFEAMDLFQARLNPVAKMDRSYEFSVSPVGFFVLDTRTSRTQSKLVADATLDALEIWAKNLAGPGVLVTSQPLFLDPRTMLRPGGVVVADHNPAFFSHQYDRIWKILWSAPYDMVVISGDVHQSYALTHTASNKVVVELVSSPMCHIPTMGSLLRGRRFVQDRSDVIDFSQIRNRGWTTTPRLLTNAQNVLCFASLWPSAANSWELRADFVDLASRMTAENKLANGGSAAGMVGRLRQR